MPDSTLHFVRMREKDSPLFVDPEAELRRIVPTAFAAVVRALMDSGEKDAADAIDSIFNVFTIRLDEDPASVCDQMEAFKNAYVKVPKETRHFIESVFFRYMLSIFALFQRRDGKVDDVKSRQLKAAAAALMCHGIGALGAAGQEALKEALTKQPGLYAAAEALDADPLRESKYEVWAKADEQIITNIKETAYHSIGGKYGDSWEDLCAKCDAFFQAEKGSEEELIAAALAYPNYDVPTTGVVVEKGTDARQD